jgi:hypothetical protein
VDEQIILNESNERYPIAVQGWQDIYKEAQDDLEFVYDIGKGQWPEGVKAEREAHNRPAFTVNKLQKFVRQLRGDALQHRTRIKVIPVDSLADVKKAELYNGIIREIEYLSDAGVAYDTAYMHAVSCSVGYLRILTKYTDDMSFNQDLSIKRVINPFSVHYDPHATEFEYEDAQYCFIEDMINCADFKQQYPKAEYTDFRGNAKTLFGEWLQGDKIRIAEYFFKEPIVKTIVQLETGEIVELTETMNPEYIKAQGGIIVRDREVHTHKVVWTKVNGAEVLEKTDWMGKDIPIIPVFGDELILEGRKHYLSLLRGAKGSQEMYNYWANAATETVALAPKAPYMVDHRQIEGFENEWDEANKSNRMYLRYNAIQGLDRPKRERPTDIPSAMMAMMSATAYDIEDHLGRYESAKGQASNERSGKAIVARIRQSDKGSFFSIDNLRKATVYLCRQLIDLIPKVYDTQRALRIRGEEGNEELIDVNKPIMNGDNSVGIENDLSVGKYDLIATVGASFSSERQEMVTMMMEAMQYAPQVAHIIAPLLFKYSDAPGAKEIYNEIKTELEKVKQMEPEGGSKTSPAGANRR